MARDGFQPLGFSAPARRVGPLVLAGYGIVATELGLDDYAGSTRGQDRRRAPLRARARGARRRRARSAATATSARKAWNARERGARALLVVDLPARPKDAAGRLEAAASRRCRRRARAATATPASRCWWSSGRRWRRCIEKLAKKQRVLADLEVALSYTTKQAFNVVGRAPRGPAAAGDEARRDRDRRALRSPRPRRHHSLAPDSHAAAPRRRRQRLGHAALLEVARQLAAKPRARCARDVVFVAFSGEEEGVLGSTHFTRTPPAGLDGRRTCARCSTWTWSAACATTASTSWAPSRRRSGRRCSRPPARDARSTARLAASGYGPSDQMPFYTAGVPVLHFFTGTHSDYHKPTDAADGSTPRGAAPDRAPPWCRWRRAVAARSDALTYKRMTGAAPPGRRAQLQRLARHGPRLRRPARRRAGRAARRRAPRRRRRAGRACGAATSWSGSARTRSAASRT